MPGRAHSAHSSARDLRQSKSVVDGQELADFTRDLGEISRMDSDDIVQGVIQAAIEDIADLARRYAPEDTGHLASSIEADVGPKTGRVVASAPYATFVEFGTWSYNMLEPKSGTYEIRPVRASALRFEIDGDIVFAQKVEHPGVKAQPFLNPAVDEVVPEFVDMLESVGVNLIVEGPRIR